MLVFFTNLGLMEFQVRYLALFLLFSVIGTFGWFWMGSLHKNIQLMLEFFNGPFLVLHFSYYTLMTFLMLLSVLLLSMLVILLSTVSVIRHLICGESSLRSVNMRFVLYFGLLVCILAVKKQAFVTSRGWSRKIIWVAVVAQIYF